MRDARQRRQYRRYRLRPDCSQRCTRPLEQPISAWKAKTSPEAIEVADWAINQ
jgi:hypothetical protein